MSIICFIFYLDERKLTPRAHKNKIKRNLYQNQQSHLQRMRVANNYLLVLRSIRADVRFRTLYSTTTESKQADKNKKKTLRESEFADYFLENTRDLKST